MYALKVREKDAQREIHQLRNSKEFDFSRKVARKGGFVFIPVVEGVPGAVRKELPLRRRIPSLKDKYGISSFDLVGDIGILWIPDELADKKGEIARHMVELYPRLKAVYMRKGAIGGDFRLPDLELLEGGGSETIHVENGLRFMLDVRKTYFSPRQASEREKLARYVDPGDVVAVFFAGIGPIPAYVSHFTEAESVYAVEHNPDACRFMEKNMRLNRCGNVRVTCGDVREEIRRLPRCDLVIMPLPKDSVDFIDEAREVLKQGGRAIVYVASTKEGLEGKLEAIRKKFSIEEVRRELEISPREFRYVVHGRVS